MLEAETAGALSEEQFAALVDTLVANRDRHDQLIDLLREDHSVYDQRGNSTLIRMRGWVLLALERTGLTDDALIFLLEELDTGVDAYLVGAAARALRTYPRPTAAFTPFLMRAMFNIRRRDEPLSFENYGAYGFSSSSTSPIHEILKTLAWLGPNARAALPQLEALHRERGFSSKRLTDLEQAIEAIRGADGGVEDCCTLPRGIFSWSFNLRARSAPIESTVFEDHQGQSITFGEFFRGQPSIVAFFYTRCDNPLKCSLTITKLGRVQKLLEAQGLTEKIRTAAITYDPEFDLAERILEYGKSRGLSMSSHNRMLRTVEGFDPLRKYFKLGVNFIESLVNRHRVEAYVLDAEGRIAATFQRLHWDEEEVVKSAVEVLNEKGEVEIPLAEGRQPMSDGRAPRKAAVPIFGTLASLGVAFFPKCPICWAAYLSVFGIAGLERIPYSPWLQPALAAVVLINLLSVWWRGRSTGRMAGFYLVSAGALAIIVSKLGVGLAGAGVLGVVLTSAGSMLSALSSRNIMLRRLM